MCEITVKKTAAKKITASKLEEEVEVSPIKRPTRTVLAIEVDGVQYIGDAEITPEELDALDKITSERDEAQVKYGELTKQLVEKLQELGIGAERPKQTSSTSKKIRRWAYRVGIEVNAHGRIPTEVRDKYESAKNKGALKDDEK